ncbi:MFS transporter [Arthrobacter sp. D2-10]
MKTGSQTDARQRASRQGRSGLIVTALCFATIVFDGYDLVVYGATLPSLLAYAPWGVEAAQAGLIGSLALLGMLFGTLIVGSLTDLFGRRKIMMVCISWFSLCMLLTALAPSAELFGLMRFLAGLGLGGVMPTCVALTIEFAPPARRQITNAIMFSGYFVGGILASVLAITLLPDIDFRWLYAFGALPLFILVPLVYRYLPESAIFLAARGRIDEAKQVAEQYGMEHVHLEDMPRDTKTGAGKPRTSLAIRTIFSKLWIASTVLFACASFCGLLLVYGMTTWLPQIMRSAGYELGASLTFLLVLNIGAMVGTIGASFVADKVGIRKVVPVCFVIACVSIILLSFGLPYGLLLAIVALAGLGANGTQILLNGFVATHYPPQSAATALSWTLGVGRLGAITGPLIGGYVASMGWEFQANFYTFGAIALVGAAAAAAVAIKRSKASVGGRA